MGWTTAAVVGYGVVLFALYGIAAMDQAGAIPWRLAHTLLYCALGVALLGALARQLPRTQPHVWRLLTLIVGAVIAGAGLWFAQPALRAPASFDAWMAAVLGLAVTAMLPRWLPTVITRRWLGIERRQRARP